MEKVGAEVVLDGQDLGADTGLFRAVEAVSDRGE